jgi:hypothetical protein
MCFGYFSYVSFRLAMLYCGQESFITITMQQQFHSANFHNSRLFSHVHNVFNFYSSYNNNHITLNLSHFSIHATINGIIEAWI